MWDDAGQRRVAAVAHYMAGQASQLRSAYDESEQAREGTGDERYRHISATMQAGAAGAEAMSNLLHAILAGDKDAAKATLHAFVNDAVDGGVVTL